MSGESNGAPTRPASDASGGASGSLGRGSAILDRRSFLKGSAALGLAAAFPSIIIAACTTPAGSPSAGTQQTIKIAASRGINSAPIWNLANTASKHGFKIEMSELFTYADQQRAAQANQTALATTGITNPSNVLDQAVGNLRVVAGMLWGGSNIIIRKGVAASTWKDLEGKKIGVTPGTYAAILFQIAATEAGVDYSKITLANISSGATALEALQKGDVDGIVLFSPTLDRAVVDGIAYYPEHIDIGASSLGPANGLILANTDFIANTELSTNFMKAYVQSVKEMQDEEAFVTLGNVVAGQTPVVTRTAFKYLHFNHIIDVNAITSASKVGVKSGFTKTDVSDRIASIIDFGPLKAATGKTEAELTGTPEAALKQVRK